MARRSNITDGYRPALRQNNGLPCEKDRAGKENQMTDRSRTQSHATNAQDMAASPASEFLKTRTAQKRVWPQREESGLRLREVCYSRRTACETKSPHRWRN
jgi:hypothetical protein